MATRKMCPHCITLYNYLGEDANGRALYNCTLLNNVHVYEGEGVNATNSADDNPHVHIFEDMVEAYPLPDVIINKSLYNLSPYNLTRAMATPEEQKPFVPYDEWKDTAEKEQYWTLNPEGGDYFAVGDHRQSGRSLPTNLTLFRVTNIAHRHIGSRRMHHWRIEAR